MSKEVEKRRPAAAKHLPRPEITIRHHSLLTLRLLHFCRNLEILVPSFENPFSTTVFSNIGAGSGSLLMTFHRSKSIREAIQLIWNVEIPSGQNESKTRLKSVGLGAFSMVLLMVLIGFGGGRGMSRGTVECSRTGLHTTCT